VSGGPPGSPQLKYLLGWVNASPVQTITTSGTYLVNRFDNATGAGTPLALKVVRDSTRNYWIGARRAFTTNASLQHGAYVIWGFNINKQGNLLDLTTPGTNVNDAALAIGSTLLDGGKAGARLRIDDESSVLPLQNPNTNAKPAKAWLGAGYSQPKARDEDTFFYDDVVIETTAN